ncbi:hypothetical protein [Clostridium sp. 001]|uniref:hypothetical protein n=1 Tax=Clostridium sp. 001 TaxID=1970093 RepID=UPI001C2B81FD|nr:hypothetical protein [Clostridium sp. 001]
MDRKEILKKLSKYRFAPGHGPDYKKMTDEQLLEQLHFFERLFEDYLNEKEN